MNSLAQFKFSDIKVPSTGGPANPNTTDVGGIISGILPYVFGAVGLLLLVYLVLGGLQLMTSRGDPKAVSAAQAKITSSLIGFVIVLLSAGVVVLLGTILKVPTFSNIFK